MYLLWNFMVVACNTQFLALFIFIKKGIVQELIHSFLKVPWHEEIGSMLAVGMLIIRDTRTQTVNLVLLVPYIPENTGNAATIKWALWKKTLAHALELSYNETILFRSKYSKPSPKKKNLLGRTEGIHYCLWRHSSRAPQHVIFTLSMT
jgi:hypothetical protein